MYQEYNSNIKENWTLNPMKYYQSGDLKLKQAWTELIIQHDVEYFITIAFNPSEKYQNFRYDEEKYRKILKQILFQFDKLCLGKTYVQKPKYTAQRCAGIIVPEHVHSNFHFHLLLKIPSCNSVQEVHQKFRTAMLRSKQNPASLNVQKVYDEVGVAEYCLKELGRINCIKKSQSIIFTSEFHSTRYK